ncbi:hypothetical protein [Aquimarina sp. MMG016]|uniref:hypothetical protein n=1 Tax=Aquimarina sp. MMG016 TaxID=2822690 RepID=UPI001B3A04E3|nr:hypothetical protein [Aquimarina sp. MMG016]MBQ4819261.1 hypothetical protein [Aquimarina sp. MMG016]
MARVLYWNIQQFGINKVNSPYFNRRQIGSTLNMQQASTQRLQYIMSTLIANVPDIFVVVETSTGAGAEGSLITAGGQQGALYLLGRIRANAAIAGNWRLVPPLILGQGGVSEGISVYYNSANLHFSGPWGWQGAANPSDSVANIGAGNLVAYALPWNNSLPAVAVPAGSNINPGINSNRLAGQWQFRGAPPLGGGPGPLLNFPAIGNRPPFLTTFWEPAGGRTIKVFAYHAPPHNPAARNGTNTISQIHEINNLGANEVAVVVGDFNVDINSANAAGAYNNLIAAGYARHINPSPAPANYPVQGYVATHMKHSYRNGATPWNTNGYPAYGYAVTQYMGNNTSSIDNILTRYGGGGIGAPANMTIVNRVAGSPYNRVMPIPAGAVPGALAYNSAMVLNGMGQPVALPLAGVVPGTVGALSNFRGWNNYGHIKSASDHMALVIDI